MSNSDWKDKAEELKFKEGISWTKLPSELKKRYGIEKSFNQIRQALRRLPSYKNKIEYTDKLQFTESDVENYIEKLVDLQQAALSLDTKQTSATIRINDNKPIAITYWGDWHIGSRGTDYIKFHDDADMICEVDGLYFIGAGDYKDNYIAGSPIGGVLDQIIQPGMQDMVVMHYMRKAKDKALAIVRGCHDSWEMKTANKDFIATICEEINAINLWHGGELFIQLGTQTYHWRCRHKYKFQSNLNLENAMRRINEIQGPCDVAAEAHWHSPYIMQRPLMGENRVMVRSGAYKVLDDFGQQIGGYEGITDFPTIIFNPEKREMTTFMALEPAVKYLEKLRS